jgi:hypothetical protein
VCKVRVEGVEDGLIPSEKLVRIATIDGTEEVEVSSASITDDFVKAGFVGEEGDNVLVELPRETASGRRRIWVGRDLVKA